MELRPLDLGGVFDRAVALYGRNFSAFFGIVVVAIVPLALLQYVEARLEAPQLDAFAAVWQHPKSLPNPHIPTIFNSPIMLQLTLASVLIGDVLIALAVSAVAVGLSRLYGNETIDIASCYRAVFRRFGSILGVLGLALLVVIGCYLVLIVIILIPVAVGALYTPALPFLILLATAFAVAAIFFVFALLLVTCAFGFYEVVVENCALMTSVRLAIARIFNRCEFGRALLCGTAAGAIVALPAGIVDALGFFALGHRPALYVTLEAIVRALLLPLSALIVAVYYFDVRIRREGFDIEAEIERAPDTGESMYAPTAYLTGAQRLLVKRFLERRSQLAPECRTEIAKRLAGPARARIPDDLQSLDDESLLERL